MEENKLLSINEVLKIAEVSRYTLYKDTKNGKIESIKFGGSVRYRASDVLPYAESKKNSKSVMVWKEKKNTQQKN